MIYKLNYIDNEQLKSSIKLFDEFLLPNCHITKSQIWSSKNDNVTDFYITTNNPSDLLILTEKFGSNFISIIDKEIYDIESILYFKGYLNLEN